MSRLVFFDLDGTLIDEPSSEKLYLWWLITTRQLSGKQLWSAAKFIITWYHQLGSEVLVKNKAYLAGLPVAATIKNAQQFATQQLLPRLRPKMVAYLKQHQAQGDTIVLLTGSPYFLAEVFAKELGITEIAATELIPNPTHFTALPPKQHPFAQSKVTVAAQLCAKYSCSLQDTVAYANSIHDLALLEATGTSIAVTPDRKLRKLAQAKHWPIIDL